MLVPSRLNVTERSIRSMRTDPLLVSICSGEYLMVKRRSLPPSTEARAGGRLPGVNTAPATVMALTTPGPDPLLVMTTVAVGVSSTFVIGNKMVSFGLSGVVLPLGGG